MDRYEFYGKLYLCILINEILNIFDCDKYFKYFKDFNFCWLKLFVVLLLFNKKRNNLNY